MVAMAKANKIPSGLDLTPLEYLQHRDITRVAKRIKKSTKTVGRVKRLEYYNVEILAALLEKGKENMLQLTKA
jgi:methylphosphotriester-DNA--protein-cysteine methyltransferase